MSTRFLLVEDEPTDAESFQRAVREIGVDLSWVKSLEEAERTLDEGDYDAVITDLSLPDASGMKTVARLVPRRLPVLVFTGQNSQDVVDKAIENGAIGVVPKSVDKEVIVGRVRELIGYVELREKLNSGELRGEIIDGFMSRVQAIQAKLRTLESREYK